MLAPDDGAAAAAAAEHLANRRARHYWDPGRSLAQRMAGVLGVRPEHAVREVDRGLAWDVYLAYGRGRDTAGAPDFWMHQLNVDHAPRLDPDEWRRRIETLLE